MLVADEHVPAGGALHRRRGLLEDLTAIHQEPSLAGRQMFLAAPGTSHAVHRTGGAWTAPATG
jgi:hypothetical protein